MDAAAEARDVPGTATVVLRQGKVVHRHASGHLDVDREAPVAMDTLFRMYSQTKPVTAAVVMSLFEDGAFLLNEPVSKWLPEFENPQVVAYLGAEDQVRGGLPAAATVPARREITLFDLLTMTSGLPGVSRTRPPTGPRWSQPGRAPGSSTRTRASTTRVSPTRRRCWPSPRCRCSRSPARPGTTARTSTCSACS